MKHALLSLFSSALVTFLVVRFDHLHAHLSADHDVAAVQKVHASPVPRVGGIGIFVGLVLTCLLLLDEQMLESALLFMLPASLVFAIGLAEDITKRVSVTMRLFVTMFAALIGCFTLDMAVRTFGVPVIDLLFQINLIAFLFTVVAVAGVSNAINLIDGFNGLSGFVCITALTSLAAVAYFVGDEFVFTMALASSAAVAGFLVWNYPNAKIFLGDGGAYFVGFIIAELSILLHERNENVSVLFPLLVVIYPVFETLFSIYRRKFVRGQSPGCPDAMHLHQLVNKRVVRWRTRDKKIPVRARGNSLTSPYLWFLNLLAAIPAVAFWDNTAILGGFVLLFVVSYTWLYSRIVNFRTPLWIPPIRERTARRKVIAISSNTAWNVYNFRGGLISALQAEGFEVVVFAPRDQYVSLLLSRGCLFEDLPLQSSSTNPVVDLLVIAKYYRLLGKYRPAAFLTFTPKPNIYGAIAARLRGVPTITNISGLGRAFINQNWITAVAVRLYRIALKHPQKVFFQNKDDLALFRSLNLVSTQKTDLLPGSGINTALFSPAVRTDKPSAFVFVLVARMLRDKGVVEYVEAARIIKKTRQDVHFQLVGFLDIDNPSAISRDIINAWVNEGVVTYLGSTDNVRPILSAADCVVLPSYREGTPRTLLEAASMACPIITTNAPGCREVVDHGVTGFLCEVKDSVGLAESMDRMLNMTAAEREKMGAAGRRKMERQYSEEIVFETYLEALVELTPTFTREKAYGKFKRSADNVSV